MLGFCCCVEFQNFVIFIGFRVVEGLGFWLGPELRFLASICDYDIVASILLLRFCVFVSHAVWYFRSS